MANLSFEELARMVEAEVNRAEPKTMEDRGQCALNVLASLCGWADAKGEVEFVKQVERLMPHLYRGLR